MPVWRRGGAATRVCVFTSLPPTRPTQRVVVLVFLHAAPWWVLHVCICTPLYAAHRVVSLPSVWRWRWQAEGGECVRGRMRVLCVSVRQAFKMLELLKMNPNLEAVRLTPVIIRL